MVVHVVHPACGKKFCNQFSFLMWSLQVPYMAAFLGVFVVFVFPTVSWPPLKVEAYMLKKACSACNNMLKGFTYNSLESPAVFPPTWTTMAEGGCLYCADSQHSFQNSTTWWTGVQFHSTSPSIVLWSTCLDHQSFVPCVLVYKSLYLQFLNTIAPPDAGKSARIYISIKVICQHCHPITYVPINWYGVSSISCKLVNRIFKWVALCLKLKQNCCYYWSVIVRELSMDNQHVTRSTNCY
jgi:hypothetical protein